MVQILRLDPLEYKEAILDSPEFRDKLKKHEKHISDTSKNIKILLKKFEDVLTASEALRNAQDSFSICLRDFQIGFVGDTNVEESDIVDTLDCTYNLFQDIKEFSTKMINTGHTLIKQLDNFRKDRVDSFKDKKKDYERQTVRYCATIEKYLQSSQYSKKDKNNSDDQSDFKEIDKQVKEENQLFYNKCLDYVLCIQEFEEKWFHFFAESIFAFAQSWTAFYHEGYEKHIDCENRFSKSHGGIQALSNNFELFQIKSKQLIADLLKACLQIKDPDFCINSYQTLPYENSFITFKQGYLYLLEKKTLGSSTRVKQFCKYYKEIRKLEVTPFNQTANKTHQPEVYYVNNCQKSTSDKRFVFDVSLRDKSYNNVHTYQALSYEDYKAWFAIMEGKELTPVLSTYLIKSDPVYILDRNGINFIKRCIQFLEDDKLNEEGIYRKNGVSHKINQFIERNFVNITSSTLSPASNSNNNSINNNSNNLNNSSNDMLSTNDSNSSHHGSTSSSFISSVLKSANIPILSHSSSFSTLSFLASSNNHQQQQQQQQTSHQQQVSNDQSYTTSISSNSSATTTSNSSAAATLATTSPPVNNIVRNSSNSNLVDTDDTCTITSALKHYLIHLKEPLMSFAFNQQFLIACRKENLNERVIEIHKLLHSLPALNFEALELLMKHLNKVSKHSQLNKMTTSNLATCFGPTVFRTEQESVSNLYNIKFYSEIVELLIVNHEQMFKPNLDTSFLNNLIPLKTPPTMIGATMANISNANLSSSSSSNSNTPLPPNTKLRSMNSIVINPVNRRAMYEPNYKNALMNSSKTSVSSDSSQSDKELQLNNLSGYNYQQITSPLSASSPTQYQRNNIIENLSVTGNLNIGTSIASSSSTTTSASLTANSTCSSASSTSSSATTTTTPNNNLNTSTNNRLSNISNTFLSQNSTPLSTTACLPHNCSSNGTNNSISSSTSLNNSGSKPYKPYNSQSTQYSQQKDTEITTNGVQKLNINGNTNRNTSQMINSNSNVNINNSNLNGSPANQKITYKGMTSTVTSLTAPSMTSLTSNIENNTSNANLIASLTASTKPKRARTLYRCEADNPQELSFDANVIISNIRRSKEAGWLEGTYNGKSGLVPGNYVQILDD